MNNDHHIDNELKELFSELNFSKPSIDLSNNIMERIYVDQKRITIQQGRYRILFAVAACLFGVTITYFLLPYLPKNTGNTFLSVLTPLRDVLKLIHQLFKTEYILSSIAILILLIADLYFRKRSLHL